MTIRHNHQPSLLPGSRSATARLRWVPQRIFRRSGSHSAAQVPPPAWRPPGSGISMASWCLDHGRVVDWRWEFFCWLVMIITSDNYMYREYFSDDSVMIIWYYVYHTICQWMLLFRAEVKKRWKLVMEWWPTIAVQMMVHDGLEKQQFPTITTCCDDG